MAFELRPVRLKDRVPFHCQLCGKCCRNVENAIMLEPLDIYRLSRHLRAQGKRVDGTEDVLAEIAEPVMLTEAVPIFTLKAVGPEQSCIFLKDGRCSVYEARPRACRLYPFTTKPGDRGREFDYYLGMDRTHHFTGGTVIVKDWFYQNFSKDERAFVKADFEAAADYGQAIRQMGSERFKGMLFQFLFYRYYNYDLDQPFLPQFLANHEAMKKLLEEAASRKGVR